MAAVPELVLGDDAVAVPFRLGGNAAHGRFERLSQHLEGREFLVGDHFTIADAYLFTVLRWSGRVKLDLSPYKNVTAYMDRVQARPKVQEAMKAEGLIQ